MLRYLNSQTKTRLRSFSHLFGLDVRLNGLNARDDLRLQHFLELHSIDLVIDVGANIGQFARTIFSNGFNGSIISFEPLPEANDRLHMLSRGYSDQWKIAPPVALGQESGSAVFYITSASSSSSLLKPAVAFTEITSVAHVAKQINVRMERLDSFTDIIDMSKNVFLKIDVQGTELQVIKGASGILDKINGLFVELSLSELYEGQSTASETHEFIQENHFKIWDIQPGYRDPQSHQLKQYDAVYFRK